MGEAPSELETLADDAERPSHVATDRIGRFVVLRRLGAGSMGAVFAAYDEALDRRVAVKVLDRNERDQALRARLHREAQALAKLSHPNVVQVYEVGTHDDCLFIAMEYVAGTTLREWMEARPRSWEEIVVRFRDAGRGLAAAHGAGLVHRDFKPDNAMVGDDGRVRVLDFGLAHGDDSRLEDRTELQAGPRPQHGVSSDGEPSTSSDLRASSQLTRTGVLMGTPAYMAPEQYEAAATDARTDQFAFCVSLWEAVYGQRPFVQSDGFALAAAVLDGNKTAPPPDRKVPAWLHAVLERGLQVDPAARYPTMDALLDELARDRGRTRRMAWLSAGALGLVALGLFSARALGDTGDPSDPCGAADVPVGDVWNETKASAIRKALVSTELPYAATTFERVRPELDAYAQRLREGYRDACEATAVRREQSAQLQDRRVRCLHRHLAHFEASVELLTTADAEVVPKASQVVASLPDAGRCADLDYIQALVAPPEDADQAARVNDERNALAQAEATIASGRWHEGEHKAADVVARARELDYEPLLAEALLIQGQAYLGAKELEAATKLLEEAFVVAYAAGDDLTSREAATGLITAVGYEQRDDAMGRHWEAMAIAAGKRVDDSDPSWRSELHRARGHAAMARGDYDTSFDALTEAAELAKSAEGEMSEEYFHVLNSLSALEAARGSAAAALPLLSRAQELAEALFGPQHPMTATALHNLGGTYVLVEQPKDALPLLQRALEIELAVYGADSPRLAGPYMNLGATHELLDDEEQAIANYERSLEILELNEGRDSYKSSRVLSNLAVARYRAGQLERAQALHERALAIAEKTTGPDHPDAAAQHAHLGKLHAAQRRWPEAAASFNRATEILRTHGAKVGYVAAFRFDAARWWWEAERDPLALEQAERAYQERRADRGGDADASRLDSMRQWLHEHDVEVSAVSDE